MKRFFFLLSLLISFSIGQIWAATSTLTFTAKCNGSGTADDGASWSISSDGTESNFDNARGIHYGTSNAKVQYITLTTSSISGTITSVVVNASDATGKATASVKVGTTDFTCSNPSATVTNSNPGVDYTFTGSASGTILVRISRNSSTTKALYVKSIVVTYTPSGSGSAPTVSFEPAAGAYTTAQNVTLTSSVSGATIYYTTDGTDPTTTSPTYSSPIAISSTTTIKAFAKKNNESGNIASAKYEFPLKTMDEIFAKATAVGGTATPVNVTFKNWVVTGVKNNNAYVTDGTKGFIIYASGHGFVVGNILSGTAACKVQLYNGSAELTELKSTTTGLSVATGGSVALSDVSAANLSGTHTGSLVKISGTCTESSGKYYLRVPLQVLLACICSIIIQKKFYHEVLMILRFLQKKMCLIRNG